MSPLIVPSDGTRVITFTDVRVPDRLAPLDTEWTSVRVDEAVDLGGPWTAIDDIPFGSLTVRQETWRWPSWDGRWGVSAQQCRVRRLASFSTVAAVLTNGWYRAVWLDADGIECLTSPFRDAAGAVTPTWAPTVQDIADLSPAYTRHPIDDPDDQSGAEAKVFDDQTNPTAADVQGFIAAGLDEVMGRVGVSVETLESYADLARSAVKWHAAATVEAERAPEAAAETDGAYRWKQSSYVACLNELLSQSRRSSLRLA